MTAILHPPLARDFEAAVVRVVVTFRFGADFDAARIREVAKAARGEFHGKPGLRSKSFSIDANLRTALHLYLWDSEDAAQDFFTPARLELITALYGVKPTVQFERRAERITLGVARPR